MTLTAGSTSTLFKPSRCPYYGVHPRPGKFVTVPVPNIKGDLLESKLFGYKKGSFTDAKENCPGFVDEAIGGTLFFDEIAEIPPDFQVKLLRLIETKRYNVLGDPRERISDIRIISATNRDLRIALKTGEFRDDLYFRLNVFPIYIPPLRERPEDIREIAEKDSRFLHEKKLEKGFWKALSSHSWRGNVRELQNVLDRLFILPCNTLSFEHVKKCLDPIDLSLKENNKTSDEFVQKIWEELTSGKNFWESVKRPFLSREINRFQVKQIIEKGISKNGNKLSHLLLLFNLPRKDYSKFKSFLYRNNILDRSSEP